MEEKMEFEEQFPSLNVYSDYDDDIFLLKKDVIHCCLDKQRVKDIIESYCKTHPEFGWLLKEFELE